MDVQRRSGWPECIHADGTDSIGRFETGYFVPRGD
jgi:hypothetical protein